jgi:hypothetical protein
MKKWGISSTWMQLLKHKGKSKAIPVTGHEGP